MWSAGCQSWVWMTFLNLRARALIGSMISSPPATARLPPGRKSYCISTTTNASSTPKRIGIVRLLSGRRGRGGCRFARGGRSRSTGQQRVALIERILGVGAIAGHHGGHFRDQIGHGLGQYLFGEAGIEILLAGVIDQQNATVDEALRLCRRRGRRARRGGRGGRDQRV